MGSVHLILIARPAAPSRTTRFKVVPSLRLNPLNLRPPSWRPGRRANERACRGWRWLCSWQRASERAAGPSASCQRSLAPRRDPILDERAELKATCASVTAWLGPLIDAARRSSASPGSWRPTRAHLPVHGDRHHCVDGGAHCDALQIGDGLAYEQAEHVSWRARKHVRRSVGLFPGAGRWFLWARGREMINKGAAMPGGRRRSSWRPRRAARRQFWPSSPAGGGVILWAAPLGCGGRRRGSEARGECFNAPL